MVTPYTDITIDSNTYIRRFNNIDESTLVWHRDTSDRIVTLIKGGCYLMLEDVLPFKMKLGVRYNIPSYTWHKIMLSTNNLEFKIIELR